MTDDMFDFNNISKMMLNTVNNVQTKVLMVMLYVLSDHWLKPM